MLIEKEEPSDEKQEPTYDEGSKEEEDFLLFGDRGEALIIHKSLLASRKEEEDWRRINIFYICCIIEKKVCKVIIDGGSYENIISQEAVTKLNLTTKKHL